MSAQAGKLHEHGDFDHCSSHVHAVLGIWLWSHAGDVCVALGDHHDECVFSQLKIVKIGH